MKPNYLTILQIISLLWSLLIQACAFQRCNQILQILNATHSTNTAKIHHFNSENRKTQRRFASKHIKSIKTSEKQFPTMTSYYQTSGNPNLYLKTLYTPSHPHKYSALNTPFQEKYSALSLSIVLKTNKYNRLNNMSIIFFSITNTNKTKFQKMAQEKQVDTQEKHSAFNTPY